MKKLTVLIVLTSILLVAGCVQEKTGEGNDTNGGIFGSLGGDRKGEQEVRATLNGSEHVSLFSSLHANAELTLEKKDCCSAVIEQGESCDTCDSVEEMWIATYSGDSKELIIGLDADSQEIIATSIPVEYLKSGKYCKVSEDCVNVGDLSGALCINEIYAMESGTPCEWSGISCQGTIECCKCSDNKCTVYLEPVGSCSSSSSGNSSTGSSGTVARATSCSGIKELLEGQKISSSEKSLELVGVYESGGQYSAKFTATSGSETVTRRIETDKSDYLAGITVDVLDIAVPLSGEGTIVSVAISGLGMNCVIS